MTGQTVILCGPTQRAFAKRLIDFAPDDAVVNVRAATRSTEQNDKMWAMLSDVSRAKPEGRKHSADVWKAIFMNACGHQVQFVAGIEGEVFPIGFRSSKLTKAQMADLITFIQMKGDEWGVKWSDEAPELERA